VAPVGGSDTGLTVLAPDAFGATPRIAGDPVILAPLGASYLEPYLLMLAEPEGTWLTGSQSVAVSRQRAEEWLTSRTEQADRADFAIVSTGSGEFLGEAVLNDFDPEVASANFRIALAGPQVFGRGFGTAATRMVLDYGFDTVGLHRIHLEVFDINPRARRTYEKCGFRYEGTQRDAHHDADGWHDVIGMALLATDPRTDTGADPL